MDDRNRPSAEILGQISLIQSMVGHLPDKENIFRFVCRGLQEVPGVDLVTYRMEHAGCIDLPSREASGSVLTFSLKAENHYHGDLLVHLSDANRFSPYAPFIENLGNMLAVIFEERRQRRLNQSILEDLERRVHERTEDLQKEIKEREDAQLALREEKERVEIYLDIIEVILVVLDDQARITLLNRKGYKVLGYSPGELEGENWFRVCLPHEDFESLFSIYQKTLAGDIQPYTYFENNILTKDGEKRYVAWHNKPFADDSGRIIGILSSGEDITERRKAEEKLRQSEENLRITLNSIGDAVISTDTTGRITRMNLVAENLTGWKQRDASGRPLAEVFHITHEHSGELVTNPVEKVLKAGTIIGLANHTILVSKNGAEYRIADSGAPIRDGKGGIAGVVLVFRDVTEQHRAEQELLKMEKLESVGILAGGIAHDFNNLLTGVFGNLEMVKMSLPEDHKAYPFLEYAERSMDGAIHLTNQLLTFAKGGDPIKEPLALTRVIAETAEFSVRGSKSKIHIDISPDLWLVEADKGQMGQVIGNLVINAEQAMPTGGMISIVAKNVEDSKGRYVRITVRDEGTGIPPNHLDKIFDPYFTTKQKGSGLGLATTHSIINKHDGTIAVDSQLNRGTQFIIHLPATRKSGATVSENNREKTRVTAEKSARILVMDDEEMVRSVIGAMLEQLGYAVEFAEGGKEAIEKYEAACKQGAPFDLVITDLTIPGGVGGQAAAEEILRMDPRAKLIVSSGYATDPVMANYQAYGFQGVAVKPFRFADLREIVRKVLKQDPENSLLLQSNPLQTNR